MSSKAIIIVAGGKGTRMKSVLPKQYICLGNLPILMHTIKRFANYDSTMSIVLVLPEGDHDYWRNLCQEYSFNIPHILAIGGETRFESVRNGLSKVTTEDYVGVHDGVRPLVSNEVIDRCFSEAKHAKAVIPVLPVFETLRCISTANTVDRSDYCLVQTPQVFATKLLKIAYQQPYSRVFTDDASVVEALGISIKLVEGNRENIKMTTPSDLKLGEFLLND